MSDPQIFIELYQAKNNGLSAHFKSSAEDRVGALKDEYKTIIREFELLIFQTAAEADDELRDEAIEFAQILRDDFAEEVKRRVNSTGERLNLTRNTLDLSLKKLSEISGYSVGAISNFENDTRPLNINAATKLGEALGGISANYLLQA